MGRRAVDLTGQRFTRLLVIERANSAADCDRPVWRCLCDCGMEVTLYSHVLRTGKHKSCGCLRRGRAKYLRWRHGKSKTRPYTMFYDARKRACQRSLPFDITPEDIVLPTHCPVLGLELDTGERENAATLDRIIPAAGYVRGNIRVISFRANRIKSDATMDELRAVLSYMEEGTK